MDHYLVAVTYLLDQNLPVPIPSGFVWSGKKQFYLKSDHQPTFAEIKQAAIKHGAGTQGFGVIAITKLEPGFRSFDAPEPVPVSNI